MAEFQKTPYVSTILDDRKLRLETEAPGGATRPATLSVSYFNNNPSISVYTNVPNDKENGKIRAPIDLLNFNGLGEQLLVLLNEPPKTQYVLQCKKADKNDFKNIQVVASIVIGKDEEGKVYISVISADNDRPKLKFYFGVGMYHRYVGGNGQKLTPADLSIIAARAWAKTMLAAVNHVSMTNYVPPPPKEKREGGWKGGSGQRQGGGNNWNRGGGNNGGGGQRQSSREEYTDSAFDDLPI